MLGLYIPTARHGAIEIRQFKTRTDVRTAVNGRFVAVDMHNPSMKMVFNIDSPYGGLKVNRRATALLWAHNEDYAFREFIYGNVVLAGPTDDERRFTDVPPDLDTLIKSRLFAIEYVQHTQPAPRVAEGIDDIWDAYAAVIRLNKDNSSKFRVVAAA